MDVGVAGFGGGEGEDAGGDAGAAGGDEGVGVADVLAEDGGGVGPEVALVKEEGVGEVFGAGHVATGEAGAWFGGFAVEAFFGSGV